MKIGLDVHNRLVNITEMDEDGSIKVNYEIKNNEEAWKAFMERYSGTKQEIAVEESTSGKYVARLLRDRGFSVHLADPVKLALIYNSPQEKRQRGFVQACQAAETGGAARSASSI